MRVFFNFLRPVLIEADGRILGDLNLVLKLMVFSLSKVYFGNTYLPLQLSANKLPFFIQIDASRVIGFIEVNKERLP